MRVMQSQKTTTVYLVDDSDSIRERVISMLSSVPGIAIAGEAKTAADAIEGILAAHPDSVLLDLNLASGTGIEVLTTVRRQLPAIKFVVLTNHAETQYRNACTKAGASYFLDKSCDFDRVPDVIAEIAATRH